METMKTLTERLRKLRIEYEKETDSKRNGYKSRLKDVENRIAQVKKRDYSAPYKTKYAEMLRAVESLIPRIEQIERSTHGLHKTLDGYMKAASVYNAEGLCRRTQGEVEKVFSWSMLQMNDIIDRMTEAKEMQIYEASLERLATVLITLRYICENADLLLLYSGIPEGERARDLEVLDAEKRNLEEECDHALKLENLDCYPFYTDVLTQYKENYARVSQDILGSENEKFYFDTEYRYLLGFYVEKIADEDRRFAKEVMQLQDAEISCQPLYFEPEKGCCNIIINGVAADFEKPLYKYFINQFYFSMARRLPANSLKYTAFACNQRTNGIFVSAMENYIKKLSDAGLYIEKGVVSTGSDFSRDVGQLRQESLHFTTADNSDIYEFNRRTSIDRKPFHLTFVDCYPVGLESQQEGIASLQQLMKEGKRSGYVTVLSQARDRFGKSERLSHAELPKFENAQAEYNAMEIDFSGDTVNVNGRPVILNIADPSFGDNDYVAYWTKLKDYYNKKEIFHLEKLFHDLDVKEQAERAAGIKRKSILETGKMSIPLGYVGTELYEMEYNLNEACHAMILGLSGSGKSSFLNTFIMGTAYKYSPREVQFYLADWKRAEFAGYKTNQLPHIRYIQDNSTVPEYVSLLHMLLRICAQRNALIESKGETTFLGYNKVVSEEERMPFILFIVDEYQSMIQQNLNGKSRSVSQQLTVWQSLMSGILSIVRSAGIGVVLCSPSLDHVDISTGNIGRRIMLGLDKALLKRLCYDNDSSGEYSDAFRQDAQYLSVTQSGHVVVGFRGKSATQRFRAAYSGEGVVRAKCLERIKERFPVQSEQLILGGSKDACSISEITVPAYETILDPVRRDSVTIEDEFAETAYDDTAYPVYIGVTSNDMSPVALQFNTKENGYVAYTNSAARLRMLVRDVMLSFLYKTTAYKGEYDCKREYYFGSKEDYANDIGGVCREMEFLAKHIAHYDAESDACESICALMKLYDVYTLRKERRLSREESAPVLVIFHGVNWLAEKEKLKETVERYRKKSGESERQTNIWEVAEQDPRLPAIIEEVRDMNFFPEERLREEALNALVKILLKERASESNQAQKEIYDASRIMDAVKTLFREGCRYRIFMFIASDVKADLRNLRSRFFETGNDSAFEKYAVFGSQLENENKFSDSPSSDGNVNTCFVYPVPEPKVSGVEIDELALHVGVLTRLYKYSKTDETFWKSLEAGLEGT